MSNQQDLPADGRIRIEQERERSDRLATSTACEPIGRAARWDR
ncbi:hypothetical protein [Halosolutus gelatinilyticus]|nr:hypothetical protein [Halosolutus gelatinilyticus]